MQCQRCTKACRNRTEGRLVRLADRDLFYCNACSLLVLARSRSDESEAIRGALPELPGPPVRRAGWTEP
jgi:hypothetical protein